MSIKEEAFKFYKKIFDSPNREEIQTVVGKFKSSNWGIISTISPIPMLGRLLFDQRWLKKSYSKSAVEELASWNEREQKILFGVHNQVRRLNEHCLAPLAAELPQAINAVNPYKEYPHTVSTEGFENLLFSEEDAREVIQSFHTHPAFDVALSTLPILRANRHSFEYDQTIPGMMSQINEAGLGGNTQWMEQYKEAARLGLHSLHVYHHVGALLSLYSSLSNLDQFIYHGLFQDELIRLNRNHIVDYFWTTAGVGPCMWLMHVPNWYMYAFEFSDLIIVNTDKPEETRKYGDVLCSIHAHSIHGTVVVPSILELRMLDEHLNAYRYLLPRA